MSAARSFFKRIGALVLCMVLAVTLLAPLCFGASATDRKVVRVGWYDSNFNRMDASGRRSGYAYEYQQRIASYTGWTYEYVEGSWTELLAMLENGEIDLLSDVSVTKERSKTMLFSAAPMGTESYYLFITTTNQDITADDLSTINEKRVGIVMNSVQKDCMLRWTLEHRVYPELIELSTSFDENMDMLYRGELDALVTMDGLGVSRPAVPVCKVGESAFYFGVNKDRPDLLAELDDAMSRIQEENRYYNQQLFDKYVRSYGNSAFLTPAETEWYQNKTEIRVGYWADYLPFCAEQNGRLTGALADYLALMEDSIKNAEVVFTPVAYPTTEALLDAIRSGEVDCAFPIHLSPYDEETMGLLTTSPLIQAELYAVTDQNRGGLSADEALTIALQEGNSNYKIFLADNFPNWKADYYDTPKDCIRAVDHKKADCVLTVSYRLGYAEQLFRKYEFQTVPTGKPISLSFAVRREDTHLYSILNKTVSLIPKSTMEAALLAQTIPEEQTTLLEFLAANWLRILIILAIVGVIVWILLQQREKEKKIAEDRQALIDETERDSLTGLYNQSFFFAYANQYYREHPGEPMEAVMLNIDSFHGVNTLYGWEFGNTVLRLLGGAIREFQSGAPGIAGRIEADCFVIYTSHSVDYEVALNKFQEELNRFNSSVRVRMGVMPKTTGVEPKQMFERARTACGLARKQFKPHLVVFDEKMHRREIFERRLLNDLEKAVKTQQFLVCYQPKFDIQCEPPKLVSAEALVRWRHPEYGILSPTEFVPFLERNGRIGVVDKYVWREVARQIAAWRKTHGVEIPVSVNLSRIDIFDPGLVDTIEELVNENELKRASLKLEVTESAYTESADQVIEVVNTLRKKGYHIEMDDFGSGYSSLNMLSTLPIDILKMDQEFVKNIGRDEKDDRLVGLILDIARNLRVPVVAEGVETREQLELLKKMGCNYVQGFFFARPLPPEIFEKQAFKA